MVDSFSSSISVKNNNTTELRQRIRTICQNIVENHAKWEAAQLRGTTLCSIIESLKKPALEDKSSSITAAKPLYPIELKTPCAKLKVITTIFEDVIDNASESTRQLEAIKRLALVQDSINDSDVLKLKTWTISNVIKHVVQLLDAYKQELELKLSVMENIAHSRSSEELILHSCVWQFPCYVNDDIKVILASLAQECELNLTKTK